MEEKIHLNRAVVVEGKYDKIKLESFLDATIIPTGGFGIFRDKEKLELLRLLAKTTGLVVLTDSDEAGFRIRGYLKGAVGGDIVHVYIPDIMGKERRKTAPSAEGKLGVEGMQKAVLLEALQKAGITAEQRPVGKRITKQDFYLDGFSGTDDSRARRGELLKRLGLPARLTTNALVDILNTMIDYESYKALAEAISATEPE